MYKKTENSENLNSQLENNRKYVNTSIKYSVVVEISDIFLK